VNTPVASLYVHVPFCAHKCSYCAFYSEAGSGPLIERYARALVRELELVAQDLRPKTVFFGGGTPSILNLRQWTLILQTMERLNLLGTAEWTVECNPATVSLDKARLWRSYGINRISMGVQSLNEHMLDRLGRIHSREMVFKSYDLLRRAGFENINLDFMFAIPGQTREIWRETLDEGIALGSEHLSCYEVIYEEDTPLFAQLAAGQITPDEDLACAMYEVLLDRTAAAGLIQYEIANFARNRRINSQGAAETNNAQLSNGRSQLSPLPWAVEPQALGRSNRPKLGQGEGEAPGQGDGVSGLSTLRARPEGPQLTYACRHNINYWRGGAYYGLGPSAAGYVRGIRTKNWSNTILYCERLDRGERAIETVEELSPLKRAGETAAFGLRMNAGWPLAEFRSVTGFDLNTEWHAEISDLLARGWGAVSTDRFHLTPAGLRFADAAAEMFLR
jgi:oxygen-independent coproporphyrinogen-3 oxidase